MKRSYSRRELYALGEPLGDSATYRKAGGLVLGDGGGGGGGGQPDKTTQVTELPEWARPYAKDTLAKGAALTDINQNPYQTYGANRIAGFSPMQQMSFQGAANMQPSQQLGTASNMAQAAGIGALGTNYQAGRFGNQFQDPGQYQPGQFSMSEAQAPNLQNFQMDPAERVRTQSFNRPGSAEAYMSPYMQNVVDIQKREAQRQSGIQGTQQQAQATQAGAFGGGRDAIMRAERERNLGQQMGDIQATGSQAAFQNAQQQFNAEQQARLQAQQANQQAGLTVGGQNLGARLGVQQLGAGQNLQAQLANQQAFQQAQRDAEQSRQFGAGQGLQAANLGAQYGQSAQQLGEQSRQYGAGLGMQGLQTGLQAAGQLGQLGGQQFQQGMDINKLQSAYGGQMQQQAQRPLDQAYQDFQNQQNYPYKQLGFMSDMIRGLPLGQQSTSSMYSQGPGAVQTLAGLGGAAYGFGRSGMFGKEGGLMTSYAEGGGVTSQDNKDSIVEGMYSMESLQKAKEAALARRDVDTAEAIDERIAQLNAIQAQSASIDRGLGSAFDQIPEERQETMMAANGGIVAFAPGGSTYDKRFNESLDTLTGMKPPEPQTAEELERGAMNRLPMLERMMGPDVTIPFAEELKSKREKLPEQMEKDVGLAFAAKSLGLLARKKRPGETRRGQLIAGIGEVGQEFAGEVSRLKKENREADEKIRQSQLLIATAQQQRKEGMAGKALASEEKADDKRQDAYKQKVEVQAKATQLLGTAYGNQLQADTSRYSSDQSLKGQLASVAAARDTANKPGEFERMLSEYEKRVGRKLTPDEYKQAMTEIGAARYGARYTGPDKTFENDAKFQKDLTDRTEMLRLQKSMPGKTPAEIEVLDGQIEAERQKLIEEYRQTRASGVTSKATPGAPAPGKSTAVAGPLIPTEAINILKSDPSGKNIKHFDKIFGPGSASEILGQ